MGLLARLCKHIFPSRTLKSRALSACPLCLPLPPALAANPIPNSKHLNLFMHLSCANGVAVVSNEIKTNGGTNQDGDEEGKASEVREGWEGKRESVIALGMCRLSGVHCDWTRLGCRLACNLQGRFYMAPSWSTCDPLSCFPTPLHTHRPSPGPHSSWPLILGSECAASLIAALPYRDAASDNGPGYTGNSPTSATVPSLVFGFSFGFL